MSSLPRLAFFVSGNGSNAKAIIDSCNKSVLKACPVVLISNNQKSKALAWAKSHGLQSQYLSSKNPDPYKDLDSLHLSILKEMEVDFVILAGYLSKNKLLLHPSKILISLNFLHQKLQ